MFVQALSSSPKTRAHILFIDEVTVLSGPSMQVHFGDGSDNNSLFLSSWLFGAGRQPRTSRLPIGNMLTSGVAERSAALVMV